MNIKIEVGEAIWQRDLHKWQVYLTHKGKVVGVPGGLGDTIREARSQALDQIPEAIEIVKRDPSAFK
jgi:hypothetical protein